MDARSFTDKAPGRITRTHQGNAAFLPDAAPRALELSEGTRAALDVASNRIGVLEGVGTRLPNPELLVAPYLRREAVLSSRIEGTQATLDDVYAREAGLPMPPDSDVQEVLNYVTAYRHGLARLATLPLSLRLVRELHERLLAGVRGAARSPGDFRTYQSFIGGTSEESATYVPPPVPEMTELLDDLEHFMHERDRLRPLVQMAVLHYQFEAIHPFGDGNGRVGRLLMALFLHERDLMPQPLLHLSPYFERTRQQYYDGLMRVSTHGDWDGWIRYVLRGVQEQADEAVDLADELQDLQEQYRNRLREARATANALMLVDFLFEAPLVTAARVQAHLDVTPPTARATIRALEREGILRQLDPDQKWGRVYVAQEILGLFRSEE